MTSPLLTAQGGPKGTGTGFCCKRWWLWDIDKVTTAGRFAVDAAQTRFTLLYETHYQAILAYLLRRLDTTAMAQDLAEDVFLVAWRKLAQVPVGEDSLYWLYAVARKTLGNHIRKTATRARIAPHLPEPNPDAAAQPEEQLVRNEEARAVTGAVANLRDRDQELIRLAYWDELPHAVIGNLLGVPRSTVDVRLHRAIRRLRKELARSTHIQIEELPLSVPKEPRC